MGNKRAKIALTDDEVAAFLADNFKVQVATVDGEGVPHLVTMFYTLYEGKIAFTTYRASQKVVNLRRNPVMTCLVEDGVEYNELRGVALRGTGRVVEDREPLNAVGAVVGSRMAGLPVPELGAPLTPDMARGIEQAMSKRVLIVMEPDRVTSWDHRKH